MMNRPTILYTGLLAACLAAACASSGPKLTRMTPDELYAYASERADAHKWRDAIAAFERFTFEYPTNPRYQEARYRLSQAHFGAKEYITAATEYARLAMDFPAGPWADESRFGVCDSYYRLSPRVELDQEYTNAAIEHCEALISYHPDSPLVSRAQEMIEMRDAGAKHLADRTRARGALDSLSYSVTVKPTHVRQRPAPARLVHITNGCSTGRGAAARGCSGLPCIGRGEGDSKGRSPDVNWPPGRDLDPPHISTPWRRIKLWG
jgi:outer membrane protein assembly factor BamD